MASVFAEWQPQYAAHGIATFPVHLKKPAVRNYLKLGLRASKDLVGRFPDSDGLGFACRRNRITVLDVDASDERLLAQALDEFGSTPFIVRSGSGHFQAWYRHNGEGRCVRPDPKRPIDILGDGFVVAPPSRGIQGSYEILSGSLEDLARLPRMERNSEVYSSGLAMSQTNKPHCGSWPSHGIKVERGQRNNQLWRECMRQAPHCDTKTELAQRAFELNVAMLEEPLSDNEVLTVVSSAWKKTEAGENWFGTGGRVVLAKDHVDLLARDHPDALILLTVLKRHQWGRAEFVVANGMAAMVGMTRKRFAAARKRLEDIGELVVVRPSNRHLGAATYRFKVVRSDHQ